MKQVFTKGLRPTAFLCRMLSESSYFARFDHNELTVRLVQLSPVKISGPNLDPLKNGGK